MNYFELPVDWRIASVAPVIAKAGADKAANRLCACRHARLLGAPSVDSVEQGWLG